MTPPTSCAAERVSPSQAHATIDASRTSSIDTVATRVAGRWWSAPSERANGRIVPGTTTQRPSAHTGALADSSAPSSEIVAPSSSKGKLHHGWSTAQKTAATPSERQVSERASRRAVWCSPAR